MDFTLNDIVEYVLKLYRKEVSPFIGIDGFCGSGKSTLAATLKKEFNLRGIKTFIISTDNFIRPKNQRELFATVFDYDYKRLKVELLKPLKETGKAKTKFYEWKSDSFRDINITLDGEIVIVEGVNSVNEMTKEFYELKIFIDCNNKTREKRVSKRGDFTKNEFAIWSNSETKLFKNRDINKYYDFIYTTF